MSSLRKGRKLLVVIFAFALLAAACGDDDNSGDEGSGTTAPPDTVTDVPEGGTVTYASDQEPTGWNVNTANDNLAALNYMTILVYPQAFDITPDFKVVMNKDLLTSAEQTSDDPQTIEYMINPDAAWSDGTPISGEDFIYNWKLQNGKVDADVGESDPEADDPTTPRSPTSPPPPATSTSSRSRAEDGKTVTVTFETPYADWQGLFGNILPAHIMKDVEGWNTSLDEANIPEWSGGPFKFDELRGREERHDGAERQVLGREAELDELVVVFGIQSRGAARGPPERRDRPRLPAAPGRPRAAARGASPRSRARSTSACPTSTSTSTC